MAADQHDLTGRRVLVVEDEYMVSMLIEDMLGDLGCEVVGTASRLDDALEKSRSLSFDIAILDVNLSGQPTFDIARVLAEREIAFVFATGYGPARLPEPLSDAPVLQKPFRRKDMERVLRAALIGA